MLGMAEAFDYGVDVWKDTLGRCYRCCFVYTHFHEIVYIHRCSVRRILKHPLF
jgi:hypothetical protein